MHGQETSLRFDAGHDESANQAEAALRLLAWRERLWPRLGKESGVDVALVAIEIDVAARVRRGEQRRTDRRRAAEKLVHVRVLAATDLRERRAEDEVLGVTTPAVRRIVEQRRSGSDGTISYGAITA